MLINNKILKTHNGRMWINKDWATSELIAQYGQVDRVSPDETWVLDIRNKTGTKEISEITRPPEEKAPSAYWIKREPSQNHLWGHKWEIINSTGNLIKDTGWFSNNTQITSIKLGANIIPSWSSFSGLTHLTDIKVTTWPEIKKNHSREYSSRDDEGKAIPDYCFHGCESLTNIDELVKDVLSVGLQSFANTKQLKKVKFNSKKIVIDEKAFLGSGVTELDFTGCKTVVIATDAFKECNVKNIKFDKDSKVIIDNDAFDKEINEYVLPEKLEGGGKWFKQNKDKLSKITTFVVEQSMSGGKDSKGKDIFNHNSYTIDFEATPNLETIDYSKVSGKLYEFHYINHDKKKSRKLNFIFGKGPYSLEQALFSNNYLSARNKITSDTNFVVGEGIEKICALPLTSMDNKMNVIIDNSKIICSNNWIKFEELNSLTIKNMDISQYGIIGLCGYSNFSNSADKEEKRSHSIDITIENDNLYSPSCLFNAEAMLDFYEKEPKCIKTLKVPATNLAFYKKAYKNFAEQVVALDIKKTQNINKDR